MAIGLARALSHISTDWLSTQPGPQVPGMQVRETLILYHKQLVYLKHAVPQSLQKPLGDPYLTRKRYVQYHLYEVFFTTHAYT